MKTGRSGSAGGEGPAAGRGDGQQQAWPRPKHAVSKKKHKKKKGNTGHGSSGASVQERIAAELARRRQRQGGTEGSAALTEAVGGGAAAGSPATQPEVSSPVDDWAAAARAKRELKAAAKKNKRDPKAWKKTTNKEKAAARLKEAQRTKAAAAAKAAAKASQSARDSVSTRDIVPGQGNAAVHGSRVRVLYVGKLLPGSGAIFDRNSNANKPLQFVIGDEEVRPHPCFHVFSPAFPRQTSDRNARIELKKRGAVSVLGRCGFGDWCGGHEGWGRESDTNAALVRLRRLTSGRGRDSLQFTAAICGYAHWLLLTEL